MPSQNSTPFPRGQTFYGQNETVPTAATSTTMEGMEADFADRDPSTPQQLRSGRNVRAVLVRNSSGIALLPNRLVKWKSGFRGTRVDGYCNSTFEEVAGVVDDFLPSTGVRNNDLFWLITEGPCLCYTAAGSAVAISVGDVLGALTAAASTFSTTSGRVQPVVTPFTATQTTDGTAFNAAVNRVGRAMSAKTTNNTNTTILVDVKLAKG